jgi:hypothetical protein
LRKNRSPGEIQTSVTVREDSVYPYALYLPSNYTPQKRWPILPAFDPVGRATLAMNLYRKGAEIYGYILVASNNSRNFSGPFQSHPADVG